jgi:hypothetical protein
MTGKYLIIDDETRSAVDLPSILAGNKNVAA